MELMCISEVAPFRHCDDAVVSANKTFKKRRISHVCNATKLSKAKTIGI